MITSRSMLAILRVVTKPVLVFAVLVVGVDVASGATESVGYLHEGSLVAWGSNKDGQATVPVGDTYVQIAGGSFHSLALKSDGSITSWGLNSFGQVSRTPSGNFTRISAGYYHSVALRADGTLAGWGYNADGQTDLPPGQFKGIAASSYQTFALRADGTLFYYDGNYPFPTGNNFTQIAAGPVFILGLRSDGSLGVGGFYSDVTNNNAPAGTFKAIAAGGGDHALAIRDDGSLAAWGWNAYGQLNVPVGNNFKQVAGGYGHSLALRTDGTLAGWGLNSGYDSNQYIGQAVVPAGDTYLQVQAGDFHSIAIKGRESYPALLISDVSDVTADDTLLQRLVNVSGDATIHGDMDWTATRGRMNVGGRVHIDPGSELNVRWGDAGEPPTFNGQAFTFFASPLPALGEFAAIHLPPLSSSLTWDTSHLYEQGFIQLVPEPACAAALLPGAFAALCFRKVRVNCFGNACCVEMTNGITRR
jgi:alpha-tubulin suppressor-like RCC1 family protein